MTKATKIPLIIAAILLVLVVWIAWSAGNALPATQHSPRYCRYVAKIASHYRIRTWEFQDGLQQAHMTAGYRRGHRITNCRVARQALENWRTRYQRREYLYHKLNNNVPLTIETIFVEDPNGALTVAGCETGHTLDSVSASLGAANGQFLGIFQLGNWERSAFAIWRGTYRYETVIDQVMAAHRYFLSNGWQPWQCLPTGGLRW